MSERIQKAGWEKQLMTLSGTYVTYLDLERKATEISEFTTQVLPGFLQITPYTGVLMSCPVNAFSKTAIEERILTRKNRQWELFERENPPRLRCVVDEGSLLRHIGGKEVMHEQLRHIIKMIDSNMIEFRVFPFTEKNGPFVAISGMTLLRFPAEQDAMWVESENGGGGLFLKGELEVAQYRRTLERLQDAALSPEASRQKILSAIELLYKDE